LEEKLHSFEKYLSVSIQEIEFELRGFTYLPWSDFILNPRRLRGSDFLMRWSQGVWSEKRILDAINQTKDFYSIPYGPSSVAPSDDVKEFELYFERLDTAGLSDIKRPDLLVFKKSNKKYVDNIINDIGGVDELPFIKENEMKRILDKSILAIECENSLWVSEKMPAYNSKLRPMRRLNGKLGLPKNAVLPTIIIKEEDRNPLFSWQSLNKIQIHIWHVFFDRAFGLSLNDAQRLLDEGLIQPTVQTFQAPGGATSSKAIYKFYYHYAYNVAVSTEQPKLDPAHIEDKNGHILPYVKFKGGKLEILKDAIEILKKVKNDRE